MEMVDTAVVAEATLARTSRPSSGTRRSSQSSTRTFTSSTPPLLLALTPRSTPGALRRRSPSRALISLVPSTPLKRLPSLITCRRSCLRLVTQHPLRFSRKDGPSPSREETWLVLPRLVPERQHRSCCLPSSTSTPSPSSSAETAPSPSSSHPLVSLPSRSRSRPTASVAPHASRTPASLEEFPVTSRSLTSPVVSRSASPRPAVSST
mmetsp:Transcript_9291/g.15911  ORF Transcript_9291/g.15911 Transcript_9291/m.15911 type:complete len:208 (-) Transcript_9291:1214-1837(-)